jgi:hypothetical protein
VAAGEGLAVMLADLIRSKRWRGLRARAPRDVGGHHRGLAGGRTVRATRPSSTARARHTDRQPDLDASADDKRFVLRFLHVARVLRAKDLRRWQAVVRRAYPHLRASRLHSSPVAPRIYLTGQDSW